MRALLDPMLPSSPRTRTNLQEYWVDMRTETWGLQSSPWRRSRFEIACPLSILIVRRSNKLSLCEILQFANLANVVAQPDVAPFPRSAPARSNEATRGSRRAP